MTEISIVYVQYPLPLKPNRDNEIERVAGQYDGCSIIGRGAGMEMRDVDLHVPTQHVEALTRELRSAGYIVDSEDASDDDDEDP